MATNKKYFETNKDTWNKKVKVHAKSAMYNLEGFKNGKSSLMPYELKALKGVNGKSLLHLQCHFGQDTLSWSRLGAKCVGVDLSDEGIALAKEVADRYTSLKDEHKVIICPPYLHLSAIVGELKGSGVSVGAQNCHKEPKGAYTGEVSVDMLSSIGIQYCLVGHSERRAYFSESDQDLSQKLAGLLGAGIHPIFCCGESLEERKDGSFFNIIEQQLELLWSYSEEELSSLIIAYEPVWAIGTGETAAADQAQEIHAFIRKCCHFLTNTFRSLPRRCS